MSLPGVSSDGESADRCTDLVLDALEQTLASTNKLKSGGLLIIDDVHRYLPRVIPSSAPFARSNLVGCASDLWREFKELTASWEQVWRSDGVQDTVIFIKPIGG